MKLFIIVALFALAAAKPSLRTSQAELDEIIAAINSPSTDPATAAALEQLLLITLGLLKPEPIQVGPAIVDPHMPIHVGPEIIDFEPIQVGPEIIDSFEPVHVGPEIVDTYEPISVGPALIDFPIPEAAVAPTPASSPLVQIIVNVQGLENVIGASPVVVEGLDKPKPIDRPTPVIVAEDSYVPEPVNVVDSLPAPSSPVIVVDQAPVAPEPVNVAPVIVSPVVVAPEILN